MEWLTRFNKAIDYIEEHLQEKIDYVEVAKCACCSVYHFQRMFSFITDISLSEYVRRRRLTLAALELQNSPIKIIDLSMKYGYDSPEAFARAFQIIHGITPSQARNPGVALKAYPRISFHISIKGDVEMNYRIEHKEAFTMYGIERIFDMANEQNLKDIPQFWNESFADGSVDRLALSVGDKSGYPANLCPVNALCGYRETGGTTFPYMLAALQTPTSQTANYTIAEVPASTWAIFTSEDYRQEETPEAIQGLTRRVYSEWLPTANFDHVGGYELEMYHERPNGMQYAEIWIRVIPKA